MATGAAVAAGAAGFATAPSDEDPARGPVGFPDLGAVAVVFVAGDSSITTSSSSSCYVKCI